MMFTRFLIIAIAIISAAGCATGQKPAYVNSCDERISFVDGSVGKLRVSDGGCGPGVPVLFIHGLGGDIETWRAQLEHMRHSRRAIAIEARGHGQSARAQDPANYTVEGMADDIAAAARRLNLSRFVLVGHSISGTALQSFAAREPERLLGLAFVDAIGDFRKAGTPEEIAQMLHDDAAKPFDADTNADFHEMIAPAKPSTQADVLRSLRELDPAAFAPLRASMARFVPPQDWTQAKTPILALEAGDNRFPVRFSVIDPKATLVTLSHVSHWLMLDDPDGTNAALDHFLGPIDLRAQKSVPGPY